MRGPYAAGLPGAPWSLMADYTSGPTMLEELPGKT